MSSKVKNQSEAGVALGIARFARISAVEGIQLSKSALREFREDDRKGATADQRRRRIIAKYMAKA